jgi:hypothetical protein
LELEGLYSELDLYYQEVITMQRELDTIRAETYLSDLKDETDFRQTYLQRVTQEVNIA